MDLDLNKRLEEENQKEMQEALEEEKFAEENKPKKTSDSKFILFTVIIVIGVIAFSLGGSLNLYDKAKVTGSSIAYTLQDLHIENLNGNLDESIGIVYDGFSIVKYEGLWYTRKETETRIIEFPLHYNPLEVQEVIMEGKLAAEFNKGEEVFIAIDPAIANKFYTLALSELSFNIVKGLERTPVGSCTIEDPVCEGREIISCDDSKGKPVIELALSEETKIESIGTCIKVSGTDEELVKAVNRLLYEWYRII
jgi:hypothetical protein